MREFDVIVAYENSLKRLGIRAMPEALKNLKFDLFGVDNDLKKLKKVNLPLPSDYVFISTTLSVDESGMPFAAHTKQGESCSINSRHLRRYNTSSDDSKQGSFCTKIQESLTYTN